MEKGPEPKELLDNADKVVGDCCKEWNGQQKPVCHGGFSNIIKAGVEALQVQVVAAVFNVRCSIQANYVSVTGLKEFYSGLYTHDFHTTWSLEDGNGRPITAPLILFGETSGPLGPEIQLKRSTGQKRIVRVMLVGPPLYFVLKQCCPRYLGVQYGGCKGGQVLGVKLPPRSTFHVILKFHPADSEVNPSKKRTNEEKAPPNSGKKRKNEQDAPPNSGLRRSSRLIKT
ncbi:unnamed protein product [Calypogeia fissa]